MVVYNDFSVALPKSRAAADPCVVSSRHFAICLMDSIVQGSCITLILKQHSQLQSGVFRERVMCTLVIFRLQVAGIQIG